MDSKTKYFWVSDTLNQHYVFAVAASHHVAEEIGNHLYKKCFVYELNDYKNEESLKKYIKHFKKYKVSQGYITVFSVPPHEYKSRIDIIDDVLKEL